MATASSSSVNRPTSREVRRQLSSDSDDRNLGALLPILFPSVSLTPARHSAPKRASSGQRFPHTPTFGSSASRKRNDISPVRRTPVPVRADFIDDSDLPVPKPSTIIAAAPDDSDELPLPDLQTIQVTGLHREPRTLLTPKAQSGPITGGSPRKRRKLSNDDAENVFLDANNDANSRNTSTVYHTIVHEGEAEVRESKSMSEIFNEALQNNSGHKPEKPAAELSSLLIEKLVQIEAADEFAAGNVLETTSDNAQQLQDTTQNHTQNLSASIDSSANTSDLGSFLGQRWKLLSRSLKRD